MRSRALVGAYWRLARDLTRAFGARYVPMDNGLTSISLTLRRYGPFGSSADDGEGSALPCNPSRVRYKANTKHVKLSCILLHVLGIDYSLPL